MKKPKKQRKRTIIVPPTFGKNVVLTVSGYDPEQRRAAASPNGSLQKGKER